MSTDVIAESLGVSSQALFKRFNSKQELLIAALLPVSDPAWHRLVAKGPDGRPLKDQLIEIFEALAGFFLDIARRMSVLRWAGVHPPELLSHFKEPPPLVDIRILSGWFRRAWQQGLVGDTDFEATAMLVLTSTHGPAMLTDMLGQRPTKHSSADYGQFLATVLLHGIRAVPETDL